MNLPFNSITILVLQSVKCLCFSIQFSALIYRQSRQLLQASQVRFMVDGERIAVGNLAQPLGLWQKKLLGLIG